MAKPTGAKGKKSDKNNGDKKQNKVVTEKKVKPAKVAGPKPPDYIPREVKRAQAEALRNAELAAQKLEAETSAADAFAKDQKLKRAMLFDGVSVEGVIIGGWKFSLRPFHQMKGGRLVKSYPVIESETRVHIPLSQVFKPQLTSKAIRFGAAQEWMHKVLRAECMEDIMHAKSEQERRTKEALSEPSTTPVNKKPTVLAVAVEVEKQATAFTSETPEVLTPAKTAKVFLKPAVADLAVPFEIKAFLGSKGTFQSGPEGARAYFDAKDVDGIGTIKLIFAEENHPLRLAFENFDTGLEVQLQQLHAEPRNIGDVRETNHAREAIRQCLRSIAIGLGLKQAESKMVADIATSVKVLQSHQQFRVRSNTQPEMRA
jgi:hypothetical protein